MLLEQGLHPRVITEGLNEAKKKALEVLENMKVPFNMEREKLIEICNTSLKTKVHHKLANLLGEVSGEVIHDFELDVICNYKYFFLQVCVDAVLAIQVPDKEIDLHMIEIMEMQHKTATETNLVKGWRLLIMFRVYPFMKRTLILI